MSLKIDEDIKRWTAKRKNALVVDILQGKTTVAEASRAYNLSPSEIEKWVDDAKRSSTPPVIQGYVRKHILNPADYFWVNHRDVNRLIP